MTALSIVSPVKEPPVDHFEIVTNCQFDSFTRWSLGNQPKGLNSWEFWRRRKFWPGTRGIESRVITAHLNREKVTINWVVMKAGQQGQRMFLLGKKAQEGPRRWWPTCWPVWSNRLRNTWQWQQITWRKLSQSSPLSVRYLSSATCLWHSSCPAGLLPRSLCSPWRWRTRCWHSVRAYKIRTEEDWANCLFSNESMVRCIQSIKTVKPPDSVMIFKEREREMIVVWFSAKGRGGFYFLPKNATMNGKRTRRFSRTTCFCGWTTWVPPTSCRTGPPATPPRGFGISWKISCSRSLTGLGTVRIWIWLKTCRTSWKGSGRTKTSALPPSWSTSWRSCRQRASSRTTAGVWATPCQVLSSRCWLPRGSH